MSGSLWKKEISLRRKARDDDAQPLVPDDVPVTDAPALPAGDYGWLTTDFDPDDVPEAMPAIVAPAVTVPVAEPVLERAGYGDPDAPEGEEAASHEGHVAAPPPPPDPVFGGLRVAGG